MKRLLTPLLFLIVFGKAYAQPTSISLGTFSGTFCAGATSSVLYSSAGGGTAKYGATNVFYVEISNATGTYSNPAVNIGTLLDDERSGSVSLSFPSTLPSGTGYRIRIVSSTSQTANQGLTSANSGAFSINAAPSIAISATSSVCVGTNTMSVGYASASGSPNQYSVTWDAAGLAAGLTNVPLTALPVSPITLSGLAGVPVGQYTGSIVVRNSTTGCSRDVTTATVCGVAAENGTVSLTSPSGLNFTSVSFASYGNATGSCGNFVKGSCDAATSIPVVQSACVGQSSCSVLAGNGIFGDPCEGTIKNLLIELKAATFAIIISPLTASITTAKPTICEGEYTTLTATPGETYLWNTGETTRSITVNPSTTTTYSCTVTNLGCNTSSASQTITVNPSPSATVTNLAPSVCKNAGTYNLSISSVTNSPNQYSIDWGDNVTAMSDIPFTAFTGTTLPITGITSTVYGSFPATIYLKNTTTGCVGNITGATVCNSVSEGSTLTMTAPGTSKFVSIPFASFGTPTGGCGSFATGSCHYANSISTVRTAAYNNSTFSILAHGSVFSPDPCGSTTKTLAVQAIYSSFAMTVVNATVTATPVDQTGCVGTNEPAYTVPTAGANSISWTNTNTGIGLAASGTDNTNPYQVPLFMAANSGLTPITGTVVVTPSSAACTGAMGTFTYTINPVPSISNQTSAICSGSAFNVSLTGVPVGTTCSWAAPTGTGFSGSSAQSGQSSVSQTLNATGNAQATATYTVTPSFSGCNGSNFTVSVKVDPSLIRTYATSGTQNFTVPTGVSVLKVEAWGGGGAGGAATGSRASGGGGSGGAYALNPSLGVTAGNTYSLRVGTGGVGGGGAGGAGQSSYFNTTGTLNAVGGAGAAVANGTNQNGNGASAVTTGNTGTTNRYGGAGGNGTGNTTGNSGGGGGSAGSAAGGNAGNGINGGAGVTDGGAGADGSTASLDGATGGAPGGGGAGGRTTSTTTDYDGGSGGAGQVKITIPNPTISYTSSSFCKSITSAAATVTGYAIGSFSSTNGLTIDPTTGTINPSTSTAGSYTIVYETACATLATFDVTIVDLPTANAGSAMAAICQGGTSAALDGSVGGTATGGTWSTTSGGAFTPNANNLSATWTPPAAFAGTATLVLTTTGSTCTAATANKTIVVKPTPATPNITGTTSYTAGGNLSLIAASTSGSSYAWTPPGTAVGLSGTATNTVSKTGIQNTEAGTYSVIATLNGCTSANATTIVTVAPLISTTGTLVAVPTTYGAASANTTFTVSGQSITQANGITITAPPGYEVSTSAGSGFATSINVGGPGTINSTTIYVRLAATTNVGSYSGNVVLSSSGAANVNKATANSAVGVRNMTVTADAATRVYGTPLTGGAGSAAFTSVGLQNGETIGSVSIAYATGAGNGNAAADVIGTYTGKVTPSAATGGTFTASNYNITYSLGNLTVTPLGLTVTGATTSNKVYNGTTAASVTGGTLVGVLPADAANVTLTQSGTFASANVGTSIMITPSFSLGGTKAGNYTLTQPTLTARDITALALTVTGATTSNKPYDGTTAASVTGGTLVGVLPADAANVTLTQSGTFASANVGTSITITPSFSLGGTKAGNYTLTQPTLTARNITALALTVTGATTSNKAYDGTTVASVTGGTLVGVLPADAANVTLTQSGTFASANVGTSITITPSFSLGGTKAGNYTLTQPTLTARNITALALTVTGATTSNKAYDGTTVASVTGGTLVGVLPADAANVTLTQSGTFASANVGTSITITPSFSLGGTKAGNYTLTQPTLTARNITALALTVTGATTSNKPYDGTTAASVTGGTLVGVLPADAANVTLTQSGTFASANVGTSITITPSFSLGGTKAGNYTLTQPTLTARNITALALTVTGATTSNKPYDGTTAASVTGGTLVGVLPADAANVTLTQSGTFASANVGTSITITPSFSLGGTKAGNYTLTQPTLTARDITAKALTVASVAATSRVYNGTNAAVITGTLTGVIGLDAVTLNGTGTFASANVGTGIIVTSTCTLGGANASNYSLAQPTGLTGNITPAALTITANNATKTYGATLTGGTGSTAFTSSGLVGAQTIGSVTIAYGTGAAATAIVNTYTGSVTASAATGGTFTASNYSINYVPGNITVNQAALVITANNLSKCVGATLNFAGTEFTTSGLVNNDAVSSVTLASTGSGSGATVAGSPYAIVPSNAVGSGLGNYTISYTNGVLTVNAVTAVNTHPVASTICNGSNTTFTVAAVGAGLTYQWREYGANITNGGVFSGATSPTLVITGATSSQDNKYYSVYVQGTCGSAVISNDALLTVKQSPTISSHPGSTSACNGGTVNYVVIASGYGLNYQWRANGSTISDNATYSGTNTSTLTLNNVNAGTSGTNYSVVVSNGCGTNAISNNATFNIIPTVTPTISISTVSPTTVCTGTSVTYTASISNGGGTPVYQWKINGSNVGTSSSSFSTSALVNGDVVSSVLTSNSQCVTSNTATSNNIAMTVLTPSVTAAASPSTTSCAGSNVSFTVAPVNGGTPSYQWKLNGNNIGGATSSTYATTALANNDQVSVVMTPTGTCTSPVTSSSLTMNILALPALTAQPSDLTKCYGDNATFAVTATGAGVSYQWKKGASNIGGAVSANYTINNVTASDEASYSVVISGTCTPSITSNTVTLAVGTSNVWNGVTTDWHTASNWTCGIMPNVGLDAIIPSSLLIYPEVASNATAIAKNVSLAAGSRLTLSANSTLNVYGNWNNAGSFYPTEGTVEFKGGSAQTITKLGATTKENFYNLTLSSGNTLTVATDVDVLAGGTVLVSSGTLDLNNKAFTLKSWAPYVSGIHKMDSTARLGRVGGTITNAANFSIERYIPTPMEATGRAYSKQRYVCSPLQSVQASQWADSVTIYGGSGATAFMVSTGWNPTISTLQSYYEPNTLGGVNRGFRPVLDRTTIMNVGKAYSLTVGFDGNAVTSKYGYARSYVVLRSKGVPTTGDFSQPLTKSGADPYGWNLVGNPYPGEIDWDLVWAANSSVVSSTLSQYDPQGGTTSGAYYYYNARTGKCVDPRCSIDSVGYLSTTRPNRSLIPSSQGFFVFARNQGNSSLLFRETQKPLTSSKVVGNYRVGDAIATVNIGVSNGTVHDNTLVYLDKSANTYGYDPDLDAFKSANTSLSISTSSFGRDLAMNGISPENGVDVPVTVTASSKGAYRLTVRLEDGDLVEARLYLKDGNTGSLTELSAGTQTFPFEVATNSSTIKRFSIVSGAPGGITTGTDGSYSADSEVKIYPNPVVGDRLTIQLPKGNGSSRQIEITDLNGILVYEMEVQATSGNYVVQGLPDILSAGVYTVRVIGEEGVKQQKFVYLK